MDDFTNIIPVKFGSNLSSCIRDDQLALNGSGGRKSYGIGTNCDKNNVICSDYISFKREEVDTWTLYF